MKAQAASEAQLHRSVVEWLELVRPACAWFHVPNGGWRHKAIAGAFKAFGVKAGVPDLVFILPAQGRAAFIELKAEGGRLSAVQVEWRDRLLGLGALWETACTVEGVRSVLDGWGVRYLAHKMA